MKEFTIMIFGILLIVYVIALRVKVSHPESKKEPERTFPYSKLNPIEIEI